MCGIAGFHGVGTPEDLENITTTLEHRGPDAFGYVKDIEQQLFLGHRRLSILDLNDGAQPMWSSDRQICVVYNGEIYNAKTLRKELETKGHYFLTDHSDTEVLIHGYREWGSSLPQRLNGMFAFAIWDVSAQKLFMARDRFGEKPFYWGQQNNLFLFGSELSVFKAHSCFETDIDTLALKKLFAFGFIPAPHSFFKGVQKLPAGSWMEYSLRTGAIRQDVYWTYQIQPAETEPDEIEASHEVLRLLEKAVQRRMISDVPLGVFLSGGIDSSAIAALACKQSPSHPIKSFSIGFTDKSYDESGYAQEMADFLGTDHKCEFFDINDLMLSSKNVLSQLDEPMGDPSLLPTHALCKMARQNVKVALSGDGGDELFAGYDTFAALKMAKWFEAFIPNLLNKALIRLIDFMPKSDKNMSLDYKLSRALSGVGHGAGLWLPQWTAPATCEMINDLLHEPTSRKELYEDALSHWESCQSDNPVDRASEYYVRYYLQDNILTKVDRASMLNSLETRAVFLDNDLVDYIAKLPASLKYRNGIRKYVLKEALRKMIPDRILERPKKGFGIPLAQLTRQLALDPQTLEQYNLHAQAAVDWKKQHKSLKKDFRLFMWNWFVLQNFR